jgi:hypothetical protein
MQAAGKPIQKPTLALGLQRGSETSHPQRELSKKGGSSRAAPVPAGYVSRTSNTWTAADYAQFKEKPPTTSAAVPSANYSAHPKLVAAAKPAKTITASPSSSPSPLPPVCCNGQGVPGNHTSTKCCLATLCHLTVACLARALHVIAPVVKGMMIVMYV